MKPHLPLKLLSALLVCLAGSVFHAHAATSWEGGDYSGNIYTWVGNNGASISSGGLSLTTSDGTTITYGVPITTWGTVTTEGTVWNLFANEGGLTEYNTMRFAASGTPITGDVSISDTNKSPACDFAPLTLGGLIVETGAEGFVLRPNNNNSRNVILGKAGDAPLPVLFTINEDFSLGTASNSWNTITINGDWNVQVGTGKTLNIFGALNAAASRTMTVGAENAGGTVVLNKAANANMQAAWEISHGATVQLKNATALGTGAVSLNGGNLSVDAGENASIANAITRQVLPALRWRITPGFPTSA